MIIKRIYFVVFVVLVLACNQKESLVDFEKEDFIVSYPVSLSITEEGEGGTVFILRTSKEGEDDSFIENINLVKSSIGNFSFEALTSKAISDIKGVADIVENKRIKINGSDCLRIIFKLSEEGKKMKVIQHFFVNKKKAYVMTFISEEGKFNKFFDEANSVLMSFKLK